MTKINNPNFNSFVELQDRAIYLVLPCVKGEEGSVASPVGALLDPRGLMSATIPAKAIAEFISKCRRQLKAQLELGSMTLVSTGPLYRL